MPPHRQPSISTHVLDNERGLPAVGVLVTLEQHRGGRFRPLANGFTDEDGRIASLVRGDLVAGVYRISFDVAAYFERQDGEVQDREAPFLRSASIAFEIQDTSRHYHVPLLMTRFACTSYRGS